jgi:hypothetical protein
MQCTTVDPVGPGTGADSLRAALGALREIQREYQDEERPVEDWFEVEDKEMHAYHRRKSRGLLFCIHALETSLKLVGALPAQDIEPVRDLVPLVSSQIIRR